MLELTGEDIAALGDEDLRHLVVMLCEAELKRFQLPESALLAGGNQTAKDGGIDVRVQLEALSHALDFIPRAQTGFQVKCEDMPAGGIAKEMRPDGELRASIKDLIARNGAYVIVSSKGTLSETFLAKRLEAMRDAIADQPGADGLRLEFYDRDRLARWVKQYIGVEMWARARVGATLTGWQGYAAWTAAELGVRLLHDDAARMVERTGGKVSALSVAAGVDRLRGALEEPGRVSRLVGLSGTGKTRLAQALFEAGIGKAPPLDRALVMYTDLGHLPDPNAREMLVRLGIADQRAMVIVDNCNPATHGALAELIRKHPKHLSLLTIEYDVADQDEPEATDVFELSVASSRVLEAILLRHAPHLSGPDQHRISDFAGGNARIALALAGTVSPGESLGTLNNVELFRRLFRQGQADSDDLLRAAEACSLVYSFDGEDTKGAASELAVLAALAGMTVPELYRHISTLRRRALVQSRSKWRALLPPALANRLAKQALQAIPRTDIMEAFEAHERLLISFSRRLEYLHDSEDARAIASRWLHDEQWLAKPGELDSQGRRLFFNLAPLAPQMVLASLEHALAPGRASEFVKSQKAALHDWSTLLRQLAYEPTAFERAARILLTLAELEEASLVDCRRAWQEMFGIGLSGTLATPAQRVQLLERLLQSETGDRLRLVWKAIDAMLEANHISSTHEFSFGARPQGYGWQPSTPEEVTAWFESAFELVRRMAAAGEEGRRAAQEAIASNFRGLWGIGLSSQLTQLMAELNGADGWPTGWTAVRSTERFDGRQMPAELLSALKTLEKQLVPHGLLQEVRTYVLGQSSTRLDLLYALDESDVVGTPVGSLNRLEDKVLSLGEALARDEGALLQCLPELLVEHSGRQQQLGYGIGRGSPDDHRQWALLRDAFVQASGSPNLAVLAGFIHGLRSRDPKTATALLESVAIDPRLDPYYPALMGAPQDDADGDRLIASMGRTNSRPHAYLLRVAQPQVTGLSVKKFCEAIEALSLMAGGLLAAVDELGRELRALKDGDAPPLAELVQAARSLLGRFEFDRESRNVAWRLNELAQVAFAGTEGSTAAAEFATRFAATIHDYRTQGDEFGDLACTLFRLQPGIALDAFLGTPGKRRHLGFRARFVARHGAVVECAPFDAILDWVRLAPAARAPLVASEMGLLAAKADDGSILAPEAKPTLNPLAARLLELAPDKAPVLAALDSLLLPSHWAGGLAQTLAPFIAVVEELANHTDTTVAAWASRNLEKMARQIEEDIARQKADEQSFE